MILVVNILRFVFFFLVGMSKSMYFFFKIKRNVEFNEELLSGI
jgi:hypothetical protein